MIRRALLSVYDKSGLVELAQGLADQGVSLVSTGSTAAMLVSADIAVTEVQDVTGFPECLDGRVKTLHPHIHAGILADRRKPEHVSQLENLGIEAFDLVVVNLYPFRETVASKATSDEVIENIDVGGPAMVRAAAKNHASVAVVVDPADYSAVLANMQSSETDEAGLLWRRDLAAKAFAHTAAYDAAIASWFAREKFGETTDDITHWPPFIHVGLERAEVLRYGENSHQQAALYVEEHPTTPGIAQAEQLSGKSMSYNNYVDGDAAYQTAYEFDEPAVAIIKHTNPCGVAVGSTIAEAHRKAHACDPLSAFGGVIASNRPVSEEMAHQLSEIFTEVIVAPSYEEKALELLSAKSSLRLLAAATPTGSASWDKLHAKATANPQLAPRFDAPSLRQISGGMLVQTEDKLDAPGDDPSQWTLVAGNTADEATLADLHFAWRAVRGVKSNAIVLASEGATVGIGMGQVNRVDAARLAVSRAGERTNGAVASSDAFFPFPDGLEILIEAGVRAIVQPGGSMRDDEVIAAAEAAGVTMYLTGVRHFAH